MTRIPEENTFDLMLENIVSVEPDTPDMVAFRQLSANNIATATRALYDIIEAIGPDNFIELVTKGILHCIKPGYLLIWQEAVDEIIAEQEAAQQYDTDHRQYG